jgi:DNA invertase Pin-like site-specific DNA recombinase
VAQLYDNIIRSNNTISILQTMDTSSNSSRIHLSNNHSNNKSESEKLTLFGIARVSSFDQKDVGLSINAQKERLLQAGVEEKNIFTDEAKSGGVKEESIDLQYSKQRGFNINIKLTLRKEFEKLLEIIKDGDTILFTKHDRLSRNILFTEGFHWYCERRNITIKALEESNDKLTRRILQVVAQTEIEKTLERNNSIIDDIYEKGFYPFRPSIGYIKNTRDKEGKLKYPNKPESSLIINEKEAEIVRECFKTAIKSKETKNKTLYNELCKRLNISAQTYYNIIHNKTYIGMTNNGIEYKKTENVPMIITEEDWKKANAKN